MDQLAKNVVNVCWAVFCVVWLLSAFFTKRTVYHENRIRRLRYMLPIIIGWFLVSRGYRFGPPFDIHLIPQTHAVLVVAAILCVVGLAFCFWARATLGRNWSGTITLKENHELIVRGPYQFVRHPIYTGLLTMMVATALIQGHVAAIIGLVLVFVSLWLKWSDEEEVMTRQFPDEYPAYRQRVKAIIPFVL